ncbi:MAG: nucleotidyltransferase substrate binding protein [Magnetococcales bacterium]|nr:nucleotidyltransferase substrate binding protein [Magnetococcales bacterium]
MSAILERERLECSLEAWGRALDRLEEALSLPPGTPLLIDGVTQRFEFCFELTWKTLKLALLQGHGFDVVSPKQSLQKAFAVAWLEDDRVWLEMLKDRNHDENNAIDDSNCL